MYDVDGSGTIQKDELAAVFKRLDPETWAPQVVRYLPIRVHGEAVLTRAGRAGYRVARIPVDTKNFRLGIYYRLSKSLDDVDPRGRFAAWGSSMSGVDEGDGWFKIDLHIREFTVVRYLPMAINGVEVLQQQEPGSRVFYVDYPLSRAPDFSGLRYCLSKEAFDFDQDGKVAACGSTIVGEDEGDGWLRVEYEDDSKINKLFDKVDSNGDDQIDYKEFFRWVIGEEEGQQVFDADARQSVQVNGHKSSEWSGKAVALFRGPLTIWDLKKKLGNKLDMVPEAVELVIYERMRVTVRLDQSDGERHGMELAQRELNDKEVFAVNKIESGLAREWNSANDANTPELTIVVGDCIVKVNGESTCPQMRQQLSENKVLEIMLEKGVGHYVDVPVEPDDMVVANHPDDQPMFYVRRKEGFIHIVINNERGRLLARDEIHVSMTMEELRDRVGTRLELPYFALAMGGDELSGEETAEEAGLVEGCTIVCTELPPPEPARAPTVRALKAALESKDIVEVKSMQKIIPGMQHVFAAVLHLHAGHSADIDVDAAGNLKSENWKAAVKMMRNPHRFVAALRDYGRKIDRGEVAEANVERARAITEAHAKYFDKDHWEELNEVVGEVASWVTKTLEYWDLTHAEAE